MRKSTIAGTAVATAFTAMMLSAGLVRPSAATPVTWDFIETSCISSPATPQSCQIGPPPQQVATLTIPNINSSGAYSIFVPPSFAGGVTTESGDMNFLFQWFPAVAPVPHSSACYNALFYSCALNISFDSSSTGLALNLHFEFFDSPFDTLIDFSGSSATIATDGFVPGCGLSAVCSSPGSGNWPRFQNPPHHWRCCLARCSYCSSGLVVLPPGVGATPLLPLSLLLDLGEGSPPHPDQLG
jgi:hypothetical protein